MFGFVLRKFGIVGFDILSDVGDAKQTVSVAEIYRRYRILSFNIKVRIGHIRSLDIFNVKFVSGQPCTRQPRPPNL